MCDDYAEPSSVTVNSRISAYNLLHHHHHRRLFITYYHPIIIIPLLPSFAPSSRPRPSSTAYNTSTIITVSILAHRQNPTIVRRGTRMVRKGCPRKEDEGEKGCCIDGRNVVKLSQCSTKHWRIAGRFSLLGLRAELEGHWWSFKVSEWDDREFEVDRKSKAKTRSRNQRRQKRKGGG